MNCSFGCSSQKVNCWIHATCSQQIYLKGNGSLHCLGQCGEHLICDWRFSCQHHQGDYNRIDFMALIDSMGAAMKLAMTYFDNIEESLLFLAGVQAKIIERAQTC